MEDTQGKLPHKLTLDERSHLTMTGVTEVVSFDETAVILHTAQGGLIIQGQGLQLKQLSLEIGQVAVDGTVTSLQYAQRQEPGGWLRRLLG